ncbi:hypothetical protein PHLCEN_2v1743 [Hermanssonia centrifuga]|uniref:Uncharacterized protein n=1 Tax=Hermanssonia centrifuga TaxID=98765 RepID=A0A2R6RW35_9APHY|nr:hypothetical protein PHLCEN_2v1743 [Hermanssonia centrifuga]
MDRNFSSRAPHTYTDPPDPAGPLRKATAMDEEKQSFKSDEMNLVSDLVCDAKADETSKLDIFARKVGNWLSQRGLEGHGCV